MWDVIMRDKEGLPQLCPITGAPKNVGDDHSYTKWFKRTARHSTQSTAASSTATELAEHDSPFHKLAVDILTNKLTPQQAANPKYRLRANNIITLKQLSLVNVLLRKNLGDARVAYYIFEHRVPTLLDPHLQAEPSTRELLQTMLEEFMMWHASLLQYLLLQKSDGQRLEQRILEDVDARESQRQHGNRRVAAAVNSLHVRR